MDTLTLRVLIAARHQDLEDHAQANRDWHRSLAASEHPDARTEAEFVLDGVAHHVFNTLRAGSPSALEEAGISDASFDDVRAIVQEEIR